MAFKRRLEYIVDCSGIHEWHVSFNCTQQLLQRCGLTRPGAVSRSRPGPECACAHVYHVGRPVGVLSGLSCGVRPGPAG